MNALQALSYGDRRALLNSLRALRTKPGRLLLWTLYAFAIAGFGWLKVTPNARGPAEPMPLFGLAVGDFWVCAFGLAFGLVLATGTSRWLGVFSSRAEALLLTRAESSPLIVAAYLQVRAVGAALARGTARFAYLIVIGIPAGNTLGGLAAQLCFFVAAGGAVASVALPRALARGAVRAAAVAGGTAIALLALLPLVLDVLRALRVGLPPPLAQSWLHPGLLLQALAGGDLRAIAIPLTLTACATAAFAGAGRDAYPELYAISLAHLERRSRRAALGPREARSGASRLRGAFAFVWVDVLTFTRNVPAALTATVAALTLAGGAAAATVAQRSPELVFGILVGTLPGLAIAVASTTGVRLAPALRMPIFWLGDVPLAARLAAWSCGPLARDGLLIGLAIAGYAAVARDTLPAVLTFCGALGLLALTRAVGLAVFALLPNALDQRGPAVMLRALLSLALIAPAACAGGAAALTLRPALASAVAAGTLTALVEAALLVTFAAWRLSGRVDRLATA